MGGSKHVVRSACHSGTICGACENFPYCPCFVCEREASEETRGAGEMECTCGYQLGTRRVPVVPVGYEAWTLTDSNQGDERTIRQDSTPSVAVPGLLAVQNPRPRRRVR